MLDFSNAPDQREFGNGPVPAGSIVIVQMEVLQPHESKRAADNPYISVAQSGLRQIYCQFSVTKGSYSGVSFRQNITLPLGGQNMRLSANQEKACNIGNATLKAICLAAKKPPKINDVTSLTGLSFPVRVKINDRPTEKDGRVYMRRAIKMLCDCDCNVRLPGWANSTGARLETQIADALGIINIDLEEMLESLQPDEMEASK